MSSSAAQKNEVRQARLALEARREQIARRQLRLRRLAATVTGAAAVVAVSVAVSSGRSDHSRRCYRRKRVGRCVLTRSVRRDPAAWTQLGNHAAPVRLVEFADLQCPIATYAVQALPTLVKDYVRTGTVQMEFENLSFIGPAR
jgi:protein-disulfide isomerase